MDKTEKMSEDRIILDQAKSLFIESSKFEDKLTVADSLNIKKALKQFREEVCDYLNKIYVRTDPEAFNEIRRIQLLDEELMLSRLNINDIEELNRIIKVVDRF